MTLCPAEAGVTALAAGAEVAAADGLAAAVVPEALVGATVGDSWEVVVETVGVELDAADDLGWSPQPARTSEATTMTHPNER
jgi:hypothetical protein